MPLVAQLVDDREAVALGQHPIDDQHVVVPVERERKPSSPSGAWFGDMADLAEGPDDVVGGVTVVFDDREGACAFLSVSLAGQF